MRARDQRGLSVDLRGSRTAADLIVERLAAIDPLRSYEDDGNPYWESCVLCEAEPQRSRKIGPDGSWPSTWTPDLHAPECPWRMAVELLVPRDGPRTLGEPRSTDAATETAPALLSTASGSMEPG